MTAFLITLFIILLLLAGVFRYFIRELNRHKRYVHRKTPADLDIPYEEVRIPVGQQSLYGWWIPARDPSTNRTVILVHGWGRNVERTLHMIEQLYPEGYSLLSIDLRDHGHSDRVKYATYRVFMEDVQAAVAFACERGTGNEEICVFGLSIGGSVAYPAAAKDQRIQKIISVGSPANPAIYMRDQFVKNHIPWFLVGWFIMGYLKYRLQVDLDRIAALYTINKSQAQCFIIHGDADETIPVKHGRLLARNGNPDRTIYWEVPGFGHSNCNEHPDYWKKVKMFLKSGSIEEG